MYMLFLTHKMFNCLLEKFVNEKLMLKVGTTLSVGAHFLTPTKGTLNFENEYGAPIFNELQLILKRQKKITN